MRRGAWLLLVAAQAFAQQQLISGRLLVANQHSEVSSSTLLPDSFAVSALTHGAVPDARSVPDATMTEGAAVLSSATAGFTGGDVGKFIRVAKAAVGGATLVSTITAVRDASTVELATPAVSTVTGSTAWWGTDNTAAFASAEATGKSVVIPGGAYLTRGNVITHSNVSWSGRGWESAIVLAGDGDNGLRIGASNTSCSSPVNNVTIRDFRIVGTGGPVPPGQETGDGVRIVCGSHVAISGIKTEGIPRAGIISIYGPNWNVQVNNNAFVNTGLTAINFNGSTVNGVVSGNTILGMYGGANSPAIQVAGQNFSVSTNTVINSTETAENNGIGIMIGEGSFTSQGAVSGNTVVNASRGIWLHGGAVGVAVSGNYVAFSNVDACINDSGLAFGGGPPSANNIISGNTVYNCASNGIKVSGEGTVVTSNAVIYDAAYTGPGYGLVPLTTSRSNAGIYVSGANVVASNNRIYGPNVGIQGVDSAGFTATLNQIAGVLVPYRLLSGTNTTAPPLATAGVFSAAGGSAVKLVCWKADGKTLGYATMSAGDISACN